MTNTLQKIMHDGDEYNFPEGFTPDSAGTQGQVLTKGASGYDWANPSGGDVVVSSDSDNVLTTGAGLRAGDESDLPASPSANCLYFCY